MQDILSYLLRPRGTPPHCPNDYSTVANHLDYHQQQCIAVHHPLGSHVSHIPRIRSFPNSMAYIKLYHCIRIVCRGSDSNRHELFSSQVFETCVSTIPPPRHHISLLLSLRNPRLLPLKTGLSDSRTRGLVNCRLEHSTTPARQNYASLNGHLSWPYRSRFLIFKILSDFGIQLA